MQLDTPLESEHIVLRTLQSADITGDYLDWLSNPVINAYLEIRFSPPRSVRELTAFIADMNTSSHTLMVGIFLQENGRHIGNIKLGPIDWSHKVADLGFLIGDKEQWGKGFASTAIMLLANYAFVYLGLDKLTAGCYAENAGSRLALLKAGFVEEGRRISQYCTASGRQDGILFGQLSPRLT